MYGARRRYWAAWHLVKVVTIPMITTVFIFILSQINFATPESLEAGTALGLGTAPMEFVWAIAFLGGYFGNRTVDYLEGYAPIVFL